jgi:hypothetical protein
MLWNPLRRFFNTQDPPQDARSDDSYFQKLLRYIPADIVAAYLVIDGALRSALDNPHWLSWSVFSLMLLLTPFYVVFKLSDPPGFSTSRNFNVAASLFAFTAWAFALDGSFAQSFFWWKPVYGTVILIFTTLMMPIAEKLFLKFSPPGPTTNPNTPPAPAPKPGTDTSPDKK